MLVAEEALKRRVRRWTAKRVVVQGFGNVGERRGALFSPSGARVVAVSDVRGGVHNPNGLDIPALVAHVGRNGSVVGFPGCRPGRRRRPCWNSRATSWSPPPCKARSPAPTPTGFGPRMIVEGANGPTTPEADAILRDRGIEVVPDVLANAGGVTVSYFEWVQDLQSFFWSEDEVNQRLARILARACAEVWAAAETYQTDLRTAAYAVGVGRVAEATRLRGIYP